MSTARQLELALVIYQTEYGNFPVTAPAGDNDFTGEISGDVLGILSGKADPLNPRQIVFIEGRQAELDRWGHPFHFAVDLNGDGELTIPDPDGSSPKVFRRQVVVWSLGPDGQPGGKGPLQADIFSTAPVD
jgi:hypothetical protein